MSNKDTCTSAGSGSYRGTGDRLGMSLSALSVGVCVVVGRWSAVLTLRRTLKGGQSPSGGGDDGTSNWNGGEEEGCV